MRTLLVVLITTLTLPLLADSGSNPPVHLAVKEWNILTAVPIHYPSRAIRHRIEGEVSILVTLDEKGFPLSVKPQSGSALLASACVDALKQWHFEIPATYGYKAPVSLLMNFQFDCKTVPEQPGKHDLYSLGQRYSSIDFIINANAMRARTH